MVLWLEWSVLSGLVSRTSLLCWAGSLESIQVCRGRGQHGGDSSPFCTGLFGGILPKQSSKCQSCRRAQGADVLGLLWLTKSSLVLKKIKQHGQKYVVEPATLPISLELTPSLHNPQLRVYSPSPLRLSPRPYSSGPTCALSRRHCPMLCRHHQPCPIPLLTRFFFLCLLPMDFYFRAVCQVTRLFSWKPFLKTLGSRSLPGLSLLTWAFTLL